MVKAKKEDLEKIIKYLEADIPNCIYLYIDITTYGVSNPKVVIWFDEDEKGLTMVAMRYFDSFQLYSDNDRWNKDELLLLLKENDVPMISARQEIVKKIYNDLSDIYEVTYGSILQLTKYRKTGKTDMVRRATEEDVPEIAKLMCDDEYYHDMYSQKALEAQLIDRMRTGMGRSFVIEEDGKIVAHDATFAETPLFFVSSGFIVHKDYRSKYYDTIIEDYMVNELGKEGKAQYSFITDSRREKLFRIMGNQLVAKYGKLVKKQA